MNIDINIDMNVYNSLARTLMAAGQLESVVNIFNNNLKERLAALNEAFQMNDRKKIKDITHSLKGSCGMFGALKCADLCQDIENAALQTDRPLSFELMNNLSNELAAFQRFLDNPL